MANDESAHQDEPKNGPDVSASVRKFVEEKLSAEPCTYVPPERCLDSSYDELNVDENITTAIVMGVLWSEFGRAAEEKQVEKLDPEALHVGMTFMRGNVYEQATPKPGDFDPKLLDAYKGFFWRLGSRAADGRAAKDIKPVHLVDSWFALDEYEPNHKEMEGEEAFDPCIEEQGCHMWFHFGRGLRSCSETKAMTWQGIAAGRLMSRVWVKKNTKACPNDAWPHDDVASCAYLAGRRAARHSIDDAIEENELKSAWCHVKATVDTYKAKLAANGEQVGLSVACA